MEKNQNWLEETYEGIAICKEILLNGEDMPLEIEKTKNKLEKLNDKSEKATASGDIQKSEKINLEMRYIEIDLKNKEFTLSFFLKEIKKKEKSVIDYLKINHPELNAKKELKTKVMEYQEGIRNNDDIQKMFKETRERQGVWMCKQELKSEKSNLKELESELADALRDNNPSPKSASDIREQIGNTRKRITELENQLNTENSKDVNYSPTM